MYTVSELAQAVGKTENFVRQHIHRGHLTPVKDGRKTHITTEEAHRWCRARGLPFTPPPALQVAPLPQDRTVRIAVATFALPDGDRVNAFTHVRIRRPEHLGPWAPSPDGSWHREKLDHGFELFWTDTDPEGCEAFITEVLTHGTILLGALACRYDVLPSPRLHWVYRNHTGDPDAQLTSPFSCHSAEMREYWSRDSDVRRILTDALEALPTNRDRFCSLGFPLHSRIDRLGNLIVSTASDQITCELSARGRRNLAFNVAGDPLPDEYSATVWAAYSGDMVFHQQLPVESGRTTIPLSTPPDRIGFEVHRASDGQCVDRMDAYLIMDVHMRLDASTGTALHLTDQRGDTIHTVDPTRSRSRIVVSANDDASTLDRIVRSRNLGYRAAEAEAAARRQGTLARFQPAEFPQAVAHFVHLVDDDSDQATAVYLADRYFLSEVDGKDGIRLYTDLLSAAAGRELRVLCTQPPTKHPLPWWKKLPRDLTRNLVVRSFLTHDAKPRPAFHDRYMVTAKRETLLSHSLNGWPHDGVTFVTLPFDVYRAEAAYLWSIDVASTSAPLSVEEYA